MRVDNWLVLYAMTFTMVGCNSLTVSIVTKGGNFSNVISIFEEEEQMVHFILQDVTTRDGIITLQISSKSGWTHAIAHPHQFTFGVTESDDIGSLGLTEDDSMLGSFNMTGEFVGFSEVIFLSNSTRSGTAQTSNTLNIKVKRSDPLLSNIFIVTIIILVSIAYVSLGCAIDFNIVIATMKRPVAPIIGLASQFIFMPLISYAIGYGLWYDNAPMWLGLFLTGSSPGGGASNMWTYLLGGSLDLSVTMTFISTVIAFGALPLWILALGGTIYRDGEFGSALPFDRIAGLIIGLVVPCAVGLAIQRYKPKVAKKIEKAIKPISLFFIIFVTAFGTYANYYIFFFFTWKVFVSGMCLPWLGFTFGVVFSKVTGRSWEETIAISVETGIQNTGIAIGVLKVALAPYAPLGDITMVVPVAVAMLTPIPLVIMLIGMKIRAKLSAVKSVEENPNSLSTITDSNNYGTNTSNGI
ncbi:unnamed protein product [Meganyctiphanes norvegica]|uniref:Ileal sodium/bile acid cotransporter n=1 Tax=Meganyctiphanes norvegica TaxID=48144 RepID=A0AAV2RJ42_MEGNR